MPINWIHEAPVLAAVMACGMARRQPIGAQRFSVIHGVLRLGLVLSIALAVGATFSVAAVPDGPRLAIIRDFPYPKSLTEIATVSAVGGALQTVMRDEALVRDEDPFGIIGSHPAFSPDGSLIAFTGSVVGADGEVESPVVLVVGADGTGLRALRGTFTEAEPIFAPDGHTIAYATLKVVGGHLERRERAQSSHGARVVLGIRSVDIEDGSQRMVTPWHPWGQDAVLYPSSYSPDGSTLAVTAWLNGSTRARAVAVRLDGSGSTLLAKNAEEPVYSPDGSRIAFVRVHTHVKHLPRRRKRTIIRKDLYVMRADGSGLTRLTHSPHLLEEWPSWDPSGERIAFNSYRPGPRPLRLPSETSVMQVNADGTCLTKVLASRSRQSLGGAAWQPGPGRGADRIECGG
jgi:Tol biopolymer transport system component